MKQSTKSQTDQDYHVIDLIKEVDIIKAGQDNKKAELEAKTKQTQADADAKAQITKADAEAQANQKINNSITDQIISYMEAQARLKHGWVTVQGAGSTIVDPNK